eukprot:GCRY01000782.1.p1 GENE.GCRY01000782.1~~GCRY01000782.1.p1  ORF type:complete len:506 (+),score=85.89 GCRY01000782.1:87-1604(+)
MVFEGELKSAFSLQDIQSLEMMHSEQFLLMKKELDAISASKEGSEKEKNLFQYNMTEFLRIYEKYLKMKEGGTTHRRWEETHALSSGEFLKQYSDIQLEGGLSELADSVAVLKLNGGLGTTMGCSGPKSVIEVCEGLTFLDLNMRQLEYINTKFRTTIPLILMNSFNTHEDSQKVVQKFSKYKTPIYSFNQSYYPRILRETLLPVNTDPNAWKKEEIYPPGHGDVFASLVSSGVLDKLLESGKEYLFISNVDNLGAVIDFNILSFMKQANKDFVMEVTKKTPSDVKGGTLVTYDQCDGVHLLEIAQVAKEHVDDFKSIRKFGIFNTNNIWLNLKTLKSLLTKGPLDLEVIVNPKQMSDGQEIIQLETAVGSAIRHFPNSCGVIVPRSRFLPVKSTSDLFLVQSNLYSNKHGVFHRNEERVLESLPIVKFSSQFKKVSDYLKRFASTPNILELEHLTVVGDVFFGKNVTLSGTVIIIAEEGQHIDIPANAFLCNNVVTGNLRIINH